MSLGKSQGKGQQDTVDGVCYRLPNPDDEADESMLITSQECALLPKKANDILGLPLEECCHWAEGGDPFPLLSIGEARTGVLCPVLGFLVQEVHGAPGESQKVFECVNHLRHMKTYH